MDKDNFPNEDYFQMQSRISNGCGFLESKLEENIATPGLQDKITIAHVGKAWKEAYTALQATSMEKSLYYGDVKHPSIRGTYLAACTIYAAIIKKSPVGLMYRPKEINPQMALTLQQYAANAMGM